METETTHETLVSNMNLFERAGRSETPGAHLGIPSADLGPRSLSWGSLNWCRGPLAGLEPSVFFTPEMVLEPTLLLHSSLAGLGSLCWSTI